MRPLFAILLFAVLFTGCSNHSGNEGSGRIAAVVNGVEITQREVEFIYQRSAVPGADEVTVYNQRRGILAGLVRAELLAQHGAKDAVDKSPDYLLALHDAQRRVLSGLVEEKIATAVKPISSETVERVIADNPNLFAERKLVVFEEVLISGVDVSFLQSLNASAGKGASLDALLDEVKARGIQFQRTTRTLTTDQIQPAILKVLFGSKPKVPVVIRVENKFSMILMLHTVVPVPLEGKAAVMAATTLLQAQQRNMVLSEKIKDLLDASKITYFGEFKPGAKLKKQGVPLPIPDQERAASKRNRQIRFGVLLFFSFSFAMMLLTSMMQIQRGTLWLPRLWPARKKEIPVVYNYEVQSISHIAELTLVFIGVSALFALAYHLHLLWDAIPLWMMAVALSTGILVGTGGSRLFALNVVQGFAEKFGWLLVILFCLLLAVTVIVTLRIVH
ncbi:MAG: EpsD family peptidyl-prolyl cis-trans isomerase [Pelodictyon phaeoclathratiforme]